MAHLVFPFSTWCVGILSNMNENISLDKFTQGGVLITTQLALTFRALTHEPKLFRTFTGASIASAVAVGGLYFTGRLLGYAIKHTIRDRTE